MHTTIDRRGKDSAFFQNKVKAGNLYPNPQRMYGQMRPRYYNVADTQVAFTAGDRVRTLKYSRDLFASSATLHGAVRQKASYTCLDAFMPHFRGANTAWGEQVEDFLKNRFYPVANVRGGNYNFTNSLFALSVALDVDGEALVYLTQSRDGFPQFGIIASHRIGQRGNEKEVKAGRYKGNPIVDGIILNANGRPIAYRILGDSADEDYDLAAQSALLLFEPNWTDEIRGVSRFGSVLIDALNQADIDTLLQMQVKLDSSMGLLSWTESGEADPSNILNPIVAEDASPIIADQLASAPQGLAVEPLLGGMINYFQAGTGEKLEAFKTDRPNANVEAFVQRLERRCMYALAWNYEALNCAALGGASVRLVQNELRNSIRARQNTLARAAKFIVSYAIAKGMQEAFIPANYDDAWFNWTFNRGELLSVDQSYEDEADRKGLLVGTTTLEQVAAKKGQDWFELRDQSQKELEDLLTRAQAIAKSFNISLDKALSLLSQRSPNESPVTQPVQVDSGTP